jgi:hypothetical protein
VDAFFFPAQSAIIPQLVGQEQIEAGNALVQITAQLAGFVGPALAGLVVAASLGVADLQMLKEPGARIEPRGLGIAFGIDALTFVIATLALWLMRSGNTVAAAQTTRRAAFSGRLAKESVSSGTTRSCAR